MDVRAGLSRRRRAIACASALALSSSVSLAAPPERSPPPKTRRTELTVVPFVGGSSDIGFGGGYVAGLVRLAPHHHPYVYRIESAGTITFDPSRASDDPAIPYVDQYVSWTLPNLAHGRIRLDLRLSYTREATLKYYGIGNASTVPSGRDPAESHFEHARDHPTLGVLAEHRRGPVILRWGASYTQNWLQIREGTKLAEDMQSGPPEVRALLGPDGAHGVPEFSFGIGWDTRDDETTPLEGTYHTLRVDLSPGALGAPAHRYGRLDFAARGYRTVLPGRLTLAARFVTDALFGNPPFYELARFDDTTAFGGPKGVRGIPAQRYYGMLKLFGNFEVRSRLFDFVAFSKPYRFGIVLFTDVGRVFADYERNADLDGPGLGLKYGLGVGPRLASGRAFVVRFDVAWSPEARPLTAYLLAGHAF
ncbi:MAG: BamA/TamA family outer membrane protein [Pseudomonadota bacterium]|nr:MAG: hypothetical protein DIU78_03615 [Pseudomonadota bacterium]